VFMGMGIWESHGNGSSFRASDGNENGNGDMGMEMTLLTFD